MFRPLLILLICCCYATKASTNFCSRFANYIDDCEHDKHKKANRTGEPEYFVDGVTLVNRTVCYISFSPGKTAEILDSTGPGSVDMSCEKFEKFCAQYHMHLPCIRDAEAWNTLLWMMDSNNRTDGKTVVLGHHRNTSKSSTLKENHYTCSGGGIIDPALDLRSIRSNDVVTTCDLLQLRDRGMLKPWKRLRSPRLPMLICEHFDSGSPARLFVSPQLPVYMTFIILLLTKMCL